MINYLIKYPVFGVSTLTTIILITIMIFRGGLNKPLRIFLYYALCQLFVDLLSAHLGSQSKNTLLICNFWHLGNFVFMSWMFRHIFINERVNKRILYTTYIFVLIFIIDILESNDNLLDLHSHKYTLIVPVLASFIILLLCLLYFLELFEELYVEDLIKSEIFWLVSGLLIYSASSVFANTVNNWYLRWVNDQSLLTIIYIPYIAYSFSMILTSIGLIITKNKPTKD